MKSYIIITSGATCYAANELYLTTADGSAVVYESPMLAIVYESSMSAVAYESSMSAIVSVVHSY